MLPEVAGQIEFSEVCFAYPSRPNMVFENLSFSIDAGKTFAIVGPSGSGKSTIISMVQRFYDPTSGKLQNNGDYYYWKDQIMIELHNGFISHG